MAQQRDVKAGYTFLFVFLASISSIHYLIPRESAFTLGIVYMIAFACYGWVCFVDRIDWKVLLTAGILLRLFLFGGLPTLSDDFYRFLWDGALSLQGVSPYLFKPTELPGSLVFGHMELLLDGLNSPDYYAVYTPIHQLIFACAALFKGGLLTQVNVMRCFFVIGDISALFLLKNLLSSTSDRRLRVLFLNPLIILEGVGNLHIELLVIPLLLLIFWLLKKQKLILSSVPMAVAVGLKLTPALLVPVIAWRYRWIPAVRWAVCVALLTLVLLAPIVLFDGYEHMRESLTLYQQSFEFNASFYYLVREVGFWHKGYNMIATIGPGLSKAAAVLILAITIVGTWKKYGLTELALFCWTTYLLLSTTIHPWYILPLVPLGILSGFSYPIVWTFTVFFSYFGYTSDGYLPPFGWIFAEYVILYGTLSYEIFKRITAGHLRNPSAVQL